MDIRLSPVIVLVNLETNYLRLFCCQSSTMLVVGNEDVTVEMISEGLGMAIPRRVQVVVDCLLRGLV